MNVKFIFFLMFSLFLVSCSSPGPTPSAQTGDAPDPPKAVTASSDQSGNSSGAITLEEINVFGEEEFFSSLICIRKHPEGYLLYDWQDKTMHLLSHKMKKISTIGGAGEGPGEFQSLVTGAVTEDQIYAYDLSRNQTTTFTLDGTFVSRKNNAQWIATMRYHNNRFYHSHLHQQKKGDVSVADAQNNVTKTIHLKSANDKTYVTYIAINDDGLVYAAPDNAYTIEVYSEDLVYQKSISLNYETPEYLHDDTFNSDFTIIPASAMAFHKNHLFVLSGGHQMNYERLSGKTLDPIYHMRIDVFNDSGKRIQQTWPKGLGEKMTDLHPTPLFEIFDEHLWVFDPSDNRLVYRYQIKSNQ